MPQTKTDEILTRLKRIEKKIDKKTESRRLLYILPLTLGFTLLATLGFNLLKIPSEVFWGQLIASLVLFAFGGWQLYKFSQS